MAADTQLLMGAVDENPTKNNRNIENLLKGFLDALIKEQNLTQTPDTPKTNAVIAQEVSE